MLTLVIGIILIMLTVSIARKTDFYSWNGWGVICLIIFIAIMVFFKCGAIIFMDVEKNRNSYDIIDMNGRMYSEAIFENKPMILFTVKTDEGELDYTVPKENWEIVYDSAEKSYVEIQEEKLIEKDWHIFVFEIPDDEILDVKYILHLPSE